MGSKIAVWLIRIVGLLALIIGLIYWLAPGVLPARIMDIHQLFGIIVAFALAFLGYSVLTSKGGSLGIAIGAIVVAFLVLVVGLAQRPLFGQLDISFHIVIRIIHLLLGITAIGMGEMIGARLRRAQKQVL